MIRLQRTTAVVLVVLTLIAVGCGNNAPSPSATNDAASTAPESVKELSAIACATADPTDVGELTGAWRGSEGGVYYIRQVGDCVWWFGAERQDIERGVTGQPGFANVASGRIDGNRIDVEWADLPLGDTLGGGGLTLFFDRENDELTVTEQRGDWQNYGARFLRRIEPEASPQSSPSDSASP